MKALTIWQPWATLIAEGLKPYEFRGWPAPASLVGQRIAIHAGARPVKRPEVRLLLMQLRRDGGFGTGLSVAGSIDLLDRVFMGLSLPHSAIVCTAIMGKPIRAADIPGQEGDSDRIDHSKWGWQLSDIHRMQPPVPATGAQGFWNFNGDLGGSP